MVLPFIIYADLECLIKKIDRCENLKKIIHSKRCDHIAPGFSMYTISSFKSIENKHHIYRGKDCMKLSLNF